MTSLTFLFNMYLICIFLSGTTFFTSLLFVIPLAMKMARVKNGLASLRKKTLSKEFLSLFVSGGIFFALCSRFFLSGEVVRYVNTLLIFGIVCSRQITELIESSIFHTQYTQEQIGIHDHIARLEEQRVKLNSDRRKATRVKKTKKKA